MTLELIVQSFTDVTPRIREFVLCLPDGSPLPGYSPGSHIDVHLDDVGKRSYSLIDWQTPSEKPTHYTVAVQREDDGQGGSRAMHALSVGQRLRCSAPENDFPLGDHSESVLLLGGGIGVTPIISLACALRDRGTPFHFHYTGRSRGVMAYEQQLSDALGTAVTQYTDDDSPLDLKALFESMPSTTSVYLCGPAGLMEATRTQAEAAGLPHDQLHVEVFAAPVADSSDQSFEIELASTGEVHVIPPGKSIIEVLEDAGVELMFDCQRGDCGICQTEVISGTPDHRDFVLSEEERSTGKVMQICVSRARSERLVLDL